MPFIMRHNIKNIETSYPLDRNVDSSNKSTTKSGVIQIPFSKIARELAPFIYLLLGSTSKIRGLYTTKRGALVATTGVAVVATGLLEAATGVVVVTTGLLAAKRSLFTAATGHVFLKPGHIFSATGLLIITTGLLAAKRTLIFNQIYLLLHKLSIASQQSIQYIIGFRWFNHYPDWFRTVWQM